MTGQHSENRPVKLVRVGRITKAHGIKGEVKAQPDFGLPDEFLVYESIVLVRPDSGLSEKFKIERCRLQANQVIMLLAGVTDRNAAEDLSGCEVWVDRLSLPELPAGRYYWHDLIGLRVETENGRQLGRVETLMPTGGHDLLVVRDRGREYLIPRVDEFLIKVDPAHDLLVVADVPGLFDLNV